MKIESIIKRKAGSTVTLGAETYRFNDANEHICEVDNETHAELLLSIPSGFRLAPGEPEPTEGDEVVKPARGRKKKAEASEPEPTEGDED